MGRTVVRGAVRGVVTSAAALLVFGASAGAQQQATGTIRGQVTDAVTMRPLAGAQVSVPGTGRGALANQSGQFLILNVPPGTQRVRVELIGYGQQEREVTVAAGQVAQIDVQLSQSALELDAIVVTGTPGQTQRRALGNAVAQFETASITESIPVRSVQELLQARTPGLTLLSDGGAAGDGSQIRLRGAGSLSGRGEPVIYVDGVRINSGTNAPNNGREDQCGSVTHCTDALDFINPNDVESIEVIKGPAASTLYGAEAAAGVIQIITKKGSKGGESVRWTASVEGGKTEWNEQRPITWWNCTESQIGNASFPGCATTGLRSFDPLTANRNALRGNKGSDDSFGADQWSTNLSVQGGGELFQFYVSGEKGEEQGIFLNNFQRRQGARANFGFTPTEEWSFNVNMGYARNHVRMPLANNSSNSILRNGMRGRADAAFQFEPGYRNFGPELANEWNTQTRAERYTIGATVNYNPFSWFQNRLVVGLDNDNRTVTDFTDPASKTAAVSGPPRGIGFIDITAPDVHQWTVDYSGTVSTDVTENYTSAFSAGVQLNRRTIESFGAEGEGLVTGNLNLVSSAATTFGSQFFEEQTSLGFYLQEQVGYKNKLFGTAAVRIDDNSAFGKDFSLVVYPKAQLSYVISDEDFFDYGFVDQLKLRGAWGQAGNPPDPFTADRTFSPDVAVESGSVVNILRPQSFGNPDLKAETGSEIELGFESSLFDSRLGVDFTYYRQKTKDALIEVPVPRSTGFGGSQLRNVGEIKNTGIELLLTGTPIYTRNLQWDATVALSTNDNELVSWGDAPLTEITFGAFATVQKHVPGYPMGGFWGRDVERGADGRPILDSRGRATVEDFEYVGPSTPTREIGITNTFTIFDDFRLFANLDYKGGHYQWCAICSVRSRIDQNTRLVQDPASDPAEVAAARSLQTMSWIQNADFIKLRELSLTYQLPAAALQHVRVDQASVTLSGRNLWMWTKYKFDEPGLGSPDPEVNFSSRSTFGRTDYASIPMLRTFSLSFRFSF